MTGTMTVTDRLKYKSIEVLLTDNIDVQTFVRTFEQMNERIHVYGTKSMIQLSLGTSPSKIQGVFSPSIIADDFSKEDFEYFINIYRTMSKAAKDAGLILLRYTPSTADTFWIR